jgi:hypothetical protein
MQTTRYTRISNSTTLGKMGKKKAFELGEGFLQKKQ